MLPHPMSALAVSEDHSKAKSVANVSPMTSAASLLPSPALQRIAGRTTSLLLFGFPWRLAAQQQSRLPETEAYYRRALAMLEATQGPNSDMVAFQLVSLTNILFSQKRYDEGELLLELSPGPWSDYHPYGDISRQNYDSFNLHPQTIALNCLKHTEHEPMTRLYVIEEAAAGFAEALVF